MRAWARSCGPGVEPAGGRRIREAPFRHATARDRLLWVRGIFLPHAAVRASSDTPRPCAGTCAHRWLRSFSFSPRCARRCLSFCRDAHDFRARVHTSPRMRCGCWWCVSSRAIIRALKASRGAPSHRWHRCAMTARILVMCPQGRVRKVTDGRLAPVPLRPDAFSIHACCQPHVLRRVPLRWRRRDAVGAPHP